MPAISQNWNSLIRPTKLVVDKEKFNTAEIVIEPLERGFGLTIGNALRRILLSSLQGAAVTSIKIDGVVHEFSSVEGVREDVPEIILNLKSLIVKMHESDKKIISIDAYGPCVVTADMIQTGHDVEVINKDLVICNLADGVKLSMELVVETGKGYVPAPQNRKQFDPIGVIPIDSLFSPVRKVFYNVENSRVGQVTDYDKLILTVETNGTITPESAVAFAARIIQDQLSLFINFEEEIEEEEDELDKIPANKKTKSGYLKDGFIVDGDTGTDSDLDDSDDTEQTEEDEDEEEEEEEVHICKKIKPKKRISKYTENNQDDTPIDITTELEEEAFSDC